MRRLLAIAAFALLLAVPLWAQHGGGHASGGHGGAFAGHGGFSGHAGGGHAIGGGHSSPSMGARGFSRGGSFHQPSFNRPSFRQPGFSSRNFHHRGPRIRTFGFGNCFGCRRWGYGYPWYGAYYDPYWWWDSGSSYDEDREREIEQANEMNSRSLEEQRMRDQQDQDLYAPRDAQPRETASTEVPGPATVLVFRDQHKQEIQNYAIVGRTLWHFAPQRTEKISLSQLDIPATTRANDERGVDFKVPATGEGQ